VVPWTCSCWSQRLHFPLGLSRNFPVIIFFWDPLRRGGDFCFLRFFFKDVITQRCSSNHCNPTPRLDPVTSFSSLLSQWQTLGFLMKSSNSLSECPFVVTWLFPLVRRTGQLSAVNALATFADPPPLFPLRPEPLSTHARVSRWLFPIAYS